MSDVDASTLRTLRRTRRDRRLGEIEWFEVAYRVYLFALVGLIAVVVASDAVGGVIGDDVNTDDVLRVGPSLLGVLVAVAVFSGSRIGAEGGPVSIESADVRHLLLSPISRRRVMQLPILQRIRSVAFAFALSGAVLGQLVAREIDGSRLAWAGSAGLFGAIVGVAYAGSAVLVHALGLGRLVVSTVAGGLLVWQVVAAWRTWEGSTAVGPFDTVGELATWGARQPAIDLVAVVVAALAVGVAVAIGGRLRVEALERRGDLVSQLRFAATVQDLRTVVLLRRQLRAESLRGGTRLGTRERERPSATPGLTRRPAANAQPPSASAVHRRGVQGLRRLPAVRWLRMSSLAAVGGLAASLAVTTSPVFLLVLVGASFALGLEAIEPLAQEVDHPSRTEALPVDRGWLHLHHLVAPAAVISAASVVGATAAAVLDADHAVAAFALAIPVGVGGAIGPVVSTVRDSPPPSEATTTSWTGAPRGAEHPFALPEFAGVGSVGSGLLPVALSAVGAIPVAVMRIEPSVGNAVRASIAVALAVGVLLAWVRHRDRWVLAVRRFFAEGRAERSPSAGTAS